MIYQSPYIAPLLYDPHGELNAMLNVHQPSIGTNHQEMISAFSGRGRSRRFGFRLSVVDAHVVGKHPNNTRL